MIDNKILFPHIAGYDKIKEEARQIIDILSNSDEYKRRGAYVPRGWFLYGDPGMGKTQIVKDIGLYLGYPIIEISSSDAIRRKVTIGEDIVNGFAEATRLDKCIVFIDEMDKFAGYRRYSYEVTENLNSQKILLHELDEIKGKDGIVVIATANKPEYLNDTILRSGRFDRQILFPRPTAKDRKEIISLFIGESKLSEDFDIDELVKLTAGCSCAEIESMVNEAKIKSILRRDEVINSNDFMYALNRIRFKDVPKDEMESDEQNKLVAYHEAGHALIGYLLQPESIRNITIIPQGYSAGSVQVEDDESKAKTLVDYENMVKVAIAGMLSVKVMTGQFTMGNTSDLKKATNTIIMMMDNGAFGIDNIAIEFYDPKYFGNPQLDKHNEHRCETMINLLNRYQEEVTNMLYKHQDKINRITNALVERKTLTKREFIDLMSA